MQMSEQIESLKSLLPAPVRVPSLRTRREYEAWKEEYLLKQFSAECEWMANFGQSTRQMVYDLLEDDLPDFYKLESRQDKRTDWTYVAQFQVYLHRAIRERDLTDTILVVQRGKGMREENIMLVRPVMGELIGRAYVNAGVQP